MKIEQITWGSNAEAWLFLRLLDLRRLPYTPQITMGFVEKGRHRNKLCIHVKIFVNDSRQNHQGKKIWISSTSLLSQNDVKLDKHGKVSGVHLLGYIRRVLAFLLTHEIDEQTLYRSERIWDPHSSSGVKRAKMFF